MPKPSLTPKVADTPPTAGTLTAYDEEHLITYLRLLDADAEGADWAEVARIVFKSIRRKNLPARGKPLRAIWPAPNG